MSTTSPDHTDSTQDLQHRLADKERQLAWAYEEINRLQMDLQRMEVNEAHVRNLKNYLALVHNSMGWKLIHPLRRTKQWLQRIRAGLQGRGFQGPRTYQDWVRAFDTPSPQQLAQLKVLSAQMDYQPLVSVVVPTYEPNLEWLQKAIDSVRQQVYPHWEICLVDDASPNPQVRPFLERLAQDDPRIKLTLRTHNGHISAASNSGLATATGEWVTFLDHDDELAPHALMYMVHAIQDKRQAQLVYSDEDKIDASGRRFDHYFKPDWNPDLLYSHNMVTHLAMYPRELVMRLGGLRDEYAGAQDYDLVLRVADHVKADEVVHVPHVLYHWRAHSSSTAFEADTKPYAMLAGERALNDHFKRTGVAAKASYMGYGFRVRYPLPRPAPLVSIIIPTRNKQDLVKVCLESIFEKTHYDHYEVLLVDNGSDDEQALAYFADIASREPRLRVIRDDSPFSFSAINNRAAEKAKGEVLVFLNNDIEVIGGDWLEELVSHACRAGVGAVGAKLLYPNQTVQHAGVVLGVGGWAGHAHKGNFNYAPGYMGRASLISGFSAVTGACLAVKAKAFFDVGGFNEAHLKVACNDVDLCLKLNALGLRTVYTPYAKLFHHESATRGYEDTDEKKERFRNELAYMQTHWADELANDPAYNPNLTLDKEDFDLAWPPRAQHLWQQPSNA